MTASTKLTRPHTERMLFGVCAGLARYLDLDVTLVRILFVILALAGGVGVLIYVAAALLIPDDREAPVDTDATQAPEPEGAPRDAAAPPGATVSSQEPAAPAGEPAADPTAAQPATPAPPFPPEPPAAPGPADEDEVHRRRRSTIGIVLVVLGVVFLVGQYVDIWRWAWPVVLIVLGVLLIFRERR